MGVGASVPAIPPLAHEASKLKRKLGKNEAKNEGVVESQPQDSSKLDVEEHKGRPAKRKTKVDPFGHEGRKKKGKAGSGADPYSSVKNDSEHSVPRLNNSTLGVPIMHSQGYPFCTSIQHSNCTLPDLLSRKERQRMGPGDQRSVTFSSPPVILLTQTTFSQSNCPLIFGTVPRNFRCA